MPSDQTPRQPEAQPPEGQSQPGQDQPTQVIDFAEALTGECGDPIWETCPPQLETSRAERARRAMREPEGKLPPGRIIDLERPTGVKGGV